MLLFFFVLQVHIGHTHRTFERNLKNERVRERQERVAKTKKKLLSLHFLKRRESRRRRAVSFFFLGLKKEQLGAAATAEYELLLLVSYPVCVIKIVKK